MTRLQRTLSRLSVEGEYDRRVGVIGGGIGFPGQPALVGQAALRSGADDVRVLVSEEIHAIVAGYSPNLLVSRYPGERFGEAATERAVEFGSEVDALVIGPGFADADAAKVRETISRVDAAIVVDALAIGPTLEGEWDDDGLSETVFTPDENEKGKIVDAYGDLETFSTETGAVVVSTGDVDEIIADGERLINETGTSALSVAGTGDTMTGIVASFLAQGMDRTEAAELGVWILGKAGELATADQGPGVVATDVIERIPDTIR